MYFFASMCKTSNIFQGVYIVLQKVCLRGVDKMNKLIFFDIFFLLKCKKRDFSGLVAVS